MRFLPFPKFVLDSALRASSARRFNRADVLVAGITLTLLLVVAKVGSEAFVRFHPPDVIPSIDLRASHLLNYAARSTLRMFVGLAASFVFTIVYGYAAAHDRRAERVLLPLLDVLQSVPVLGFLSVTVAAFISLFRGSLLGLEAASVFAIFTGQAWNMTFSFYQSLRTIPPDLEEMASLYRLSRWERFSRLELPASAVGLVWNAMMSFGGGWFFLAASESISVLNHRYTLPGLGSYVAVAIENKDLRALGWAIVVMIGLVLLIDQFFWKPLVVLADRYKLELSAGEERRFWVVDLWRASNLLPRFWRLVLPLRQRLDRALSRASQKRSSERIGGLGQASDLGFNAALLVLSSACSIAAVVYVVSRVGLAEVGQTTILTLITLLRVLLLIVLSTLVWTPIGVAIGFSPRLARLSQPLVQICASFPANFLFPFATILFLKAGVSLNWGSIFLMALGAQWYILFNVIGGAQAVPNDLREMASDIGLNGWRKWRMLICPAIFGSWVTGAITASGGAWNASIVAETVAWGQQTFRAKGVGTYIADATARGDWPRIVLGVFLMSIFVVAANRLLWRPLYSLAQQRYRLN